MNRDEILKIKNLSVEKLLEELDYCGCDTYYLDYRNIIVAEIKSRLNENEQLAKKVSDLQSDLSKAKSQIDKIKEAYIDYQMVKDVDPDFHKYVNNIILGKWECGERMTKDEKHTVVSITTKPDNCLKLFFLLQEQKTFKDKIILRIDFEDTYSLHFNYLIPSDIELYTRINVNALTESIKPHLIGEPADVFTTYCIALSILVKELNNKNIGVYVSEEIEKLVLHKIESRGQINEKRKI